MSKWITLRIEVADGVEADDIVSDVNAGILCKLEEDDKKIIGWEWAELGSK